MITEENQELPIDTSTFGTRVAYQFDEGSISFLKEQFAKLRQHKKAETILNNGVKKLVKFCFDFPGFGVLRNDVEELSKRLTQILASFATIAGPELSAAEIFAFHSFHEFEFFFKNKNEICEVSLSQFSVLLNQFAEYMEHAFNFESFGKLDAELSDTLKLPPFLSHLAFKGLSFEYFFKLRCVVDRVTCRFGQQQCRERLSELNLLGYLDKYASLKCLRNLTDHIPDYFRSKNLFGFLSDHSALELISAECVEEYSHLFEAELLNAGWLCKLVSKGAKREALKLDNLPSVFVQPAEKSQLLLSQMIAQNILRNNDFHKLLTSQCDMSLRMSTYPTIIGKDSINVFSRNYVLKRLHSIKLKRAHFRLLVRIVKEHPNGLFEVEFDHLKLKSKFKVFLMDLARKAFHLDESDLAHLTDDAKRLNRKWNKLYEKGFGLAIERFIGYYVGFYFDNAARVSCLWKAWKFNEGVRRSLMVHPVWKRTQNRKVLALDDNFGVFEKLHNCVIRLSDDLKTLQLSFWKGLVAYQEHHLDILEIDYANRKVILDNDLALSDLMGDFMPNTLVVIADKKESHFLKSKVFSSISTFIEADSASRFSLNVYFFKSELLELLFETVKHDPEWSLLRVYNAYIQNPLLTFLTLFDPQSSLVSSRMKREVLGDFGVYLAKMTVIETVCTKDINLKQMTECPLADTLTRLFGFKENLDSLRGVCSQNRIDFSAGVTKLDLSQKNKWLVFGGRNNGHSQVGLFSQVWSKERAYQVIKDRLLCLNESILETYSVVVRQCLYGKESDFSGSDSLLLTNFGVNDNPVFMSLLLRQVLAELLHRTSFKVVSLRHEISNQVQSVRKMFKDELDLRTYSAVEMTVTSIESQFVRGRVGKYFWGRLAAVDISNDFAKPQKLNLSVYFSVNQTIKVLITQVHPDLLQLDVSLHSKDIDKLSDFPNLHGLFREYRLTPGVHFSADPKRDIPLIPGFDKTERFFDFFATEHPHLHNFNLSEAKSTLRERKEDSFLFKPSHRDKSSYFDLMLYFHKKDLVMALPISLGERQTDGTVSVSHSPQKYKPENLELKTFVFGGNDFAGMAGLEASFVQPLMGNLSQVFECPRYTTLPKSFIKNEMDSADNGLSLPDQQPVSFYLRKHPVVELQFKLYFKDQKGIFGFKLLKVDHLGFTLLARFEDLKCLIDDFIVKAKTDQFMHSLDNQNDESILSAINESSSVMSVVSQGSGPEFQRASRHNSKSKQSDGKQFNFGDGNDSDLHGFKGYGRSDHHFQRKREGQFQGRSGFANGQARNDGQFGGGGQWQKNNRGFGRRDNQEGQGGSESQVESAPVGSFGGSGGTASVPVWGNSGGQSSGQTWGNKGGQSGGDSFTQNKTRNEGEPKQGFGGLSQPTEVKTPSWGVNNEAKTQSVANSAQPTWGNQVAKDTPSGSWGNRSKTPTDQPSDSQPVVLPQDSTVVSGTLPQAQSDPTVSPIAKTQPTDQQPNSSIIVTQTDNQKTSVGHSWGSTQKDSGGSWGKPNDQVARGAAQDQVTTNTGSWGSFVGEGQKTTGWGTTNNSKEQSGLTGQSWGNQSTGDNVQSTERTDNNSQFSFGGQQYRGNRDSQSFSRGGQFGQSQGFGREGGNRPDGREGGMRQFGNRNNDFPNRRNQQGEGFQDNRQGQGFRGRDNQERSDGQWGGRQNSGNDGRGFWSNRPRNDFLKQGETGEGPSCGNTNANQGYSQGNGWGKPVQSQQGWGGKKQEEVEGASLQKQEEVKPAWGNNPGDQPASAKWGNNTTTEQKVLTKWGNSTGDHTTTAPQSTPEGGNSGGWNDNSNNRPSNETSQQVSNWGQSGVTSNPRFPPRDNTETQRPFNDRRGPNNQGGQRNFNRDGNSGGGFQRKEFPRREPEGGQWGRGDQDRQGQRNFGNQRPQVDNQRNQAMGWNNKDNSQVVKTDGGEKAEDNQRVSWTNPGSTDNKTAWGSTGPSDAKPAWGAVKTQETKPPTENPESTDPKPAWSNSGNAEVKQAWGGNNPSETKPSWGRPGNTEVKPSWGGGDSQTVNEPKGNQSVSEEPGNTKQWGNNQNDQQSGNDRGTSFKDRFNQQGDGNGQKQFGGQNWRNQSGPQNARPAYQNRQGGFGQRGGGDSTNWEGNGQSQDKQGQQNNDQPWANRTQESGSEGKELEFE
jgi:hypothetical protein